MGQGARSERLGGRGGRFEMVSHLYLSASPGSNVTPIQKLASLDFREMMPLAMHTAGYWRVTSELSSA